MAKQIKVFNGSIQNTSQTIYTVPAGRVAEVTVSTINLTGSQYGSSSLLIGGEIVAFAPGSYNTYFYMPAGSLMQIAVVAGNEIITDPDMRIASLNSTPIPLKGKHYLSAGQTIQINMGYQNNSATWSFLVIEEY